MKLTLTPQEKEAFISVIHSEGGRIFRGFLDRLNIALSDITTLSGKDLLKELEVRREVIGILKENILDKFKVLSGEVEPPEQNEYR